MRGQDGRDSRVAAALRPIASLLLLASVVALERCRVRALAHLVRPAPLLPFPPPVSEFSIGPKRAVSGRGTRALLHAPALVGGMCATHGLGASEPVGSAATHTVDRVTQLIAVGSAWLRTHRQGNEGHE